ncbi:MAG: hypothetical protein DRQ64_00625 [Gammaproteobacteria bacterium]|nr:MAG: hypothetical protein DRQ64_00625 [Gammaproteobacteria bacterium]
MIDNKLTSSAPGLTTLPLKPALLSGLLFTLLLMAISPKTLADATAIAEVDELSNPAKAPIPNLSASNSKTASTRSSAPTETPVALASYYSTLQSYEAEGPYHQNASEVLYGLGLQLQKRGQHRKALKALRRAMHINRVNSGLNSLSQAPMLRGIINSQKSLVHIEPVTTSYNQLLRMHIAAYGRHDPRIIPLLSELGMWHLDAYQFDESDIQIDHLTSAYSLVTSALQLSETSPSSNPAEQIELLRGVALVNFHLSRHQGDGWSSSTSSHYSLSADGFATTNPQRTKILSGASFRRGLMCHQRIIALTAANPNSTLADNIQAQTELADWYLLFNRQSEAMALYQQVQTKIAASDQAETLQQQIFATPRLLPAIRMEHKRGVISDLFMSADVDISDQGWGSSIENIAENRPPGQSPSNKKGLRYKMLDAIKGARFRPQFVDNNPADVSDVTVHLPLIH